MHPEQTEAFLAGLADAMIQERDALDPDPDLERDVLDEPHDAEEDACACEDYGGEPSLGAPEVEFNYRGLPEWRGHVDQRRWADGGAANDDGEPSLGWCENVSQLGLVSGPWDAPFDDADSTAPERYGMGFVRCGPDDYEPSLGAGNPTANHGTCISFARHVTIIHSANQSRWAEGGSDDDRELGDDNGIADDGGLNEQWGAHVGGHLYE